MQSIFSTLFLNAELILAVIMKKLEEHRKTQTSEI